MNDQATGERELMLTGIGGQGVQLAAQVIAQGATADGKEVLVFGSYGGMMRGGNTDSTVVISDHPIEAPPVLFSTWSAILMHHQYWTPLRERIRDHGLVLVNTSVFEDELDQDRYQVVEVPATDVATDLGNPLLAAMVMSGVYGRRSGLVSLDGLVEGMRRSVPPYRSQLIEANEGALASGWEMAA
ncbi:MAG: 2-oxoacid:acceptor oxidoreductase family protein [bacterium]|nr:2-oxoacid:acceptor oxidoreductase family protein [bacterium]MCY3888296.1 2-oxoacid:acceptor oxidoreductase family protein [bacterium]MCY3961695.1 2-oxoacid:acceptor oxidoreductase family protein [bacterium]MCY4134906.1 2-oxoacid:acceptor oxidoreductase family protein [bacterium]